MQLVHGGVDNKLLIRSRDLGLVIGDPPLHFRLCNLGAGRYTTGVSGSMSLTLSFHALMAASIALPPAAQSPLRADSCGVPTSSAPQSVSFQGL